MVHPCSSIDMTAAWKRLRFILSDRSDFYSLSMAVHAFASCVWCLSRLMRHGKLGRWNYLLVYHWYHCYLYVSQILQLLGKIQVFIKTKTSLRKKKKKKKQKMTLDFVGILFYFPSCVLWHTKIYCQVLLFSYSMFGLVICLGYMVCYYQRISCVSDLFNYYFHSLRVFHMSVSWSFSGVKLTTSHLKSPGLFSVFWPISEML